MRVHGLVAENGNVVVEQHKVESVLRRERTEQAFGGFISPIEFFKLHRQRSVQHHKYRTWRRRRSVARRAAGFVEDRRGFKISVGLALGQSRVAQLVGGNTFGRAISEKLERRAFG